MTRTLSMIPLMLIVPPKVALRTVDKESDAYKEFVASIARDGILNPVSVKPVKVTGEEGAEVDMYQIVDGLHRYSGAIDAGLEELPCQILDADEAHTLELQIEGNVHRFETRPVQYSKQLLKILAAHPGRTVKEQAKRLGKSEGWLKDKLRLQRLAPHIQTLVDEGEVVLSSAYMLAKLDEEEQENYLELAKTLPPDQFLPQCSNRIAELKKLKAGEPKPEPSPVPTARKRGEIVAMYNSIAQSEPKNDREAGFAAAIQWAVQMDQNSIKAWHAKRDEAEAKKKAKADEKRAEKAAKETSLPSLDDLLK